MLVEQLIS